MASDQVRRHLLISCACGRLCYWLSMRYRITMEVEVDSPGYPDDDPAMVRRKLQRLVDGVYIEQLRLLCLVKGDPFVGKDDRERLAAALAENAEVARQLMQSVTIEESP